PLTPQTLVVNCRTQRQFPNKVISAGKQLRQGLPAALLVGKGEIGRIKRPVAGVRRGEILVLAGATPRYMLPSAGRAARLPQPLARKGRLGHSPHSPNNNFCVVDFRRAPGAVDVIYVGMDGKPVAKASCSVALKPATLP